MKNKIQILFQFYSNQFKSPQISIKSNSLDLDKIVTNDQEQFIVDANFGIHDFSILLLNKEPNDTVVDNDGNILDDLYVIIEDILIDNITIKNHIDCFSEYTDNNGEKIKTFGYLSFATEFKFWLQVPGYIFKRNISALPDKDILQFLRSECKFD